MENPRTTLSGLRHCCCRLDISAGALNDLLENEGFGLCVPRRRGLEVNQEQGVLV